jgi:hypothetical protein
MISLSLAAAACQQPPELSETAQAKTPAIHASAANPIVVELYQSQGCSSCPPANAALNAIADQPGVIALSFAVTYWDRLGWKDIYGDKAYTQRQYDYAHALGNANVATPQIIINGKTVITGIKRGELATSIKASRQLSGGPSIDVDKTNVTIGKGSGTANVWLVGYDPRTHNVAIRSGENGGRTLPHKNIVRSLQKLGTWTGAEANFKLPTATPTPLKTVIIVQRAGAGPIIAAKKVLLFRRHPIGHILTRALAAARLPNFKLFAIARITHGNRSQNQYHDRAKRIGNDEPIFHYSPNSRAPGCFLKS